MSIFDRLKKNIGDAAKSGINSAVNSAMSQKETFTFKALPESLAELQALPEASLDTPFATAALTVCALCVYPADKNIGVEMLRFLHGPREMSNLEIQFLDDRFRDGHYVPFSYFKGAIPSNDYTPDEPFTITIESGAYSDANLSEGYKKLFIKSGGADGLREIVLRKAGSGKWYLWDQFLLSGIRKAKSDDPWA